MLKVIRFTIHLAQNTTWLTETCNKLSRNNVFMPEFRHATYLARKIFLWLNETCNNLGQKNVFIAEQNKIQHNWAKHATKLVRDVFNFYGWIRLVTNSVKETYLWLSETCNNLGQRNVFMAKRDMQETWSEQCFTDMFVTNRANLTKSLIKLN